MNKAETWRDAARQANERRLLNQTERMSELAAAAETMAVSMAKLSEETRETLAEIGSTTAAARARQKESQDECMTVLNALTAKAGGWKTTLDEAERKLARSLRGITIWIWLAMTASAILAGALTGWLTWRLSDKSKTETASAYEAGMRAAIEGISRNYNITEKTVPPKPSRRSSGPSAATGTTSESGTSKPAE